VLLVFWLSELFLVLVQDPGPGPSGLQRCYLLDPQGGAVCFLLPWLLLPLPVLLLLLPWLLL
jgi:hypothetical protein